MRHLVWIKFIFFFQSASMTVLYPYLNLHMKYLGLNVQEVAIINAVIPILFIFTPPLAGFLAQKVGNFRVLLSVLTAWGACLPYYFWSSPQLGIPNPTPQTFNGVSVVGAPATERGIKNLCSMVFVVMSAS